MAFKALIAIAIMFLATDGFSASALLDRDGSKLKVRIDSVTSGTWLLTTGDRTPCASGSYSAGTSYLEFDKLSAPDDVILNLSGIDGSNRQVEHSGDVKLSTLAKPEGAAVIYQLPVRTYFARANGKEYAGRLSGLTTDRLLEIQNLGVDYLWLTGILEYASLNQTDPDVVKGEAGSFYAIYDNWDVSEELGGLQEFEALIDRAHAIGMRVMIDFVGNHTARVHRTDVVCKDHLDFGANDQTHAFFNPQNNYFYIQNEHFTPPAQPGASGADGVFDTDIFTSGVQLEYPARVTGNDIVSAQPEIYDWFETAKLNYGFNIQNREQRYDPRPRTWDQMLDVASYWLEKGVDGFRFDFAHAVPLEFWRYLSENLRQTNPNVFLMAEAYESDARMRVPGFSYTALLDAGFDTVYNSELYWAIHNNVNHPGQFKEANPDLMPSMRHEVRERGMMFTTYMENHDEVRVASRHFARWVGNRGERAELGLALAAYSALLPGHFMLHGGQELQEDATIFGSYAGDNGRTSIFDYVYQSQTRSWLYRDRPQWMRDFRKKYQSLIRLKKQPPFRNPHSNRYPTYVGLAPANNWKEQAKWIGAYVRYDGTDAYVVVTNSDPFNAHEATLHFTGNSGHDTFGGLYALGVNNTDTRYRFVEVLTRQGFEPTDPNIEGPGVPGWALFRSGGVPSGLYLGEIPPRTTWVFKVVPE